MRDVVVTGLGAVTSVGTGADELVESLLAGASGVRQSSEEGAPATAPCADFDPEAWMTPKEARRTDRFAQLALAAALQAAKEAGLPGRRRARAARHPHGHRRRRARDAAARV